jgi:hypothetical protein
MVDRPARARRRTRAAAAAVAIALGMMPGALVAATGTAVAITGLALSVAPPAAVAATASGGSASTGTVSTSSGSSLEDAASRAGDTGRKVAFSLIGLALAVAAIVLAFKRDFKEAVGVLAIGLVAVLLASPTGVNVLQQTVSMLFGGA